MKKIRFLIPFVISILIFFVIFMLGDLYPFGDGTLIQVDADYQYVPVLYRIYDFIHGNGNIIYDDIGMGNNIYISMIIQGSIFSPLSLLLYFTSRENIVNYFNIIVMMKICLISLSCYVYIDRSYKVNEYYKIIFSLLYAFSGWVLLNYFNVMWLDCVILFPLIVMYLDKLLNDSKYVGYIITLSMSLIISYYISYFILLFILFYTFMYVFLKLDKSKIKEVVFRIGICTFIAILISSFSLLPALYQTIISSRIDGHGISDIFKNIINKSLYLMLSSVFFVIFIMLVGKYKKDGRNIYIYLILFMLFSIGILVEPINLAMHMGSYWSFPYRYSFIAIFIMMIGSLYYISNYKIAGYAKYNVIRFILFLILGMCLVYGNHLYCDDIREGMILLDFNDIDIFKYILVLFSIVVVMIMISFSFRNRYFKYISFSIVCLLEIFVYSSWCMYNNDGYYLSSDVNDMYKNMDIVNSDIGRYKIDYMYYTPDIGFIHRINTLDNWLHILPSSEIDIYKRLGYGNSNTSVRSYGGTVLTDWLFNVRYLINDKNMDNNIYNLLDRYDRYYLYEYNYDSNFGYIYDNKNVDDYEYLDGFRLHNRIYRDIIGKDNDIVNVDSYNDMVVNDVYVVDYHISEIGYLYIDFIYDIDYIDYIKVNGRYINYFNENYIIDLGIYDSDVKIEIGVKDIDSISFDIGFIKYSDVMELESSGIEVVRIDNGYDIELYNDMDDGRLFLPINNIDGVYAYVNDSKVEIESYMNNFVSIKLDSGDNKIEVRYEMPLFKLGIILSILGVICLLLYRFIIPNRIILNIMYYVYIGLCLLLYVYFYGYSMIRYWKY